MPTKNFLVGFFTVPGVKDPVVVEIPLTGNGSTDYRYLKAEVQKLYPRVAENQIIRHGSVIEARDEDELEWLNPSPGQTLRQIFPVDAMGSVEEYHRVVGSVFFDGGMCKISLRYHVAPGTVSVVLVDRLTKHTIRFTEQFNASVLLKDVPGLLQEVLGRDGRELRLRIKPHSSDAVQEARERLPNLNDQIPPS